MPESLRLGVLATHPIQYFAPLFRELHARSGLDVTVFYAHRPSPEEQGAGFGVPFTWDVDLLDGYRSIWLTNRSGPQDRGAFFGYDTPEIRSHIRQRAFDAFLVAGWHALAYWQAILGCWNAGVPVLVRGDSQLGADEFATRRYLKRFFYPFFISRFAACLSVGQRSEEYFRHFGARRIVRAPHFVDNAFFRTEAESRRRHAFALRTRWGIREGARVVLFAGKMVEKKRPLDVLRAAALLRGVDLHLLFAGDGPLRERCEREAARLGVPATFAGFLNQKEIPDAYALADVLVLPSDHRETWGLVVNEAMASGVPAVVSTSVGCYPDLILEGKTGFGFPLGDARRLADAVAIAIGSAERLAALRNASVRHVATFSVKAAADGVIRGAATAMERAA